MEDYLTVATLFSLADAEPRRLALEAAGIHTLATDEGIGELLVPTMVGGIKLQVAAKDADRAKEVLAEFGDQSEPQTDNADDSGDDVCLKCPACEAEICFPSERRGHVETCPKCGTYVDVPKADGDVVESDVDEPEGDGTEP